MRQYKSELANTMVEGNYFRYSSVPNCFPCGSASKESTCNGGDLGSIPGLGRSPWRRKRLPTPVSWPGEFHKMYSPWDSKESDTTEQLHFLSPTNESPTSQLHKQQAQAEPERHVWHRRESDESGESAPEEGGEGARATQPIPRSASYPCAAPRPGAPETTALQGGFQRRYGGITGMHWGYRRHRAFREEWSFWGL